jgi:hypothetical protein
VQATLDSGSESGTGGGGGGGGSVRNSMSGSEDFGYLRASVGSMKGLMGGAGAAGGADAGEWSRSSLASIGGGSLSRSISLARKDGSVQGGLLRLSSSHSPVDRRMFGASISDPTAFAPEGMDESELRRMKRSLEQFDMEEALDGSGGDSMHNDAPMLASITSSTDFRRGAARASAAASPLAAAPVGDREQHMNRRRALERESGIASISEVSAASSAGRGQDSLVYSPSVSVSASAAPARSRYSADATESDEEGSGVDSRFRAAANRAGRNSTASGNNQPSGRSYVTTTTSDFSMLSDSEGSTTNAPGKNTGKAGADKGRSWAAAGSASSEDGYEDNEAFYAAEGKRSVGDEGKVTDSVDSFKREYLAGRHTAAAEGSGRGQEGEGEETDAAAEERLLSTGGDMSSVQTFGDESINSNTYESAVSVPRPAAAGARRGAGFDSKSNVESFADDDTSSVHSLALSDSNNLDEV